MEPFTQYFVDHLPTAIIVIIAVLVSLILGAWWASSMWHRFKSLPCSQHDSSIERHSDKIDAIGNSLSRIEGKMDAIIRLLPQSLPAQRATILSDDGPTLSQKHSPKVLNGNGIKILDAFDGMRFVDDNIDWLVSEVEKLSPKTALDVETCSFTALRLCSFDDRFNAIKGKIYNSPAFELSVSEGKSKSVEVTLEDVLFVMSLPLRDEYLKRHREISA